MVMERKENTLLGGISLEEQRLRKFDHKMMKYDAQIKEIWISEKYRRTKYLGKESAGRQKIYRELATRVSELVRELEETEFIESELVNCRDEYLRAGKALLKAYEAAEKNDPDDIRDFAEYTYYAQTAREELNRLWQRHNE